MWASTLIAVATITGIALASGLLLGLVSRRLPPSNDSLVDRVDALLPQLQCAQCGYPGCRPYAAAIVEEDAGINLCPPGGDETVRRLASLLDREPLPLADGASTVSMSSLAIIEESLCIGCGWCREVCPVDAISGAHHYMHTVLARECTGCELCVPRCPVDCIRLVPAR
jgi:Na+-translocating ferredoxin:NAD+ oxidoreductase subunit B